MSKVIDERVVEMRFDNKDFESNVQTSLKTIDKLKDSLNFDDATRSVGKFQDSLKHFSLDDIGNAVEGLSSKFNWSNIFKMDLLNNVTSQIYSTITGVFGRIKGALQLENVDPVSNMLEGWNKYAEKTQSVATIMAATGKSIEAVDQQMERLLYFTDETSYSFTDMTSNIGKFTANGIELEAASTAMQGIATWAARSGQSAGTASRVMYNLAQAIGMGALKLQDWKSVELANMGTKEFKELAIQVGLTTGALTKNAEGLVVIADGTENTLKETVVSVENFRETLKDGWLDNDTLMGTLEEYGKAADLINDLNEQTGMYASEIIELAKATQDSSLSLKEFAKMAGLEDLLKKDKKAVLDLKQAFQLLGSEEYAFSLATYEAAQEARTFGDAMKSVADAVSSGWMKTFELLFGGYDTAKVLWTDLAVNLSEIFRAATDDRNALIEEANYSGWDHFVAKLEEADIHMLDLESSMRNIVGTDRLATIVERAGSFEEAIKQGKFSVDQLSQAIDGLPGSFQRVKEISGEVIDNYEEMTAWSWELRKGMYDYVGHDDQVEKLMKAKNITKEYAEQVVSLSEKHEQLGRELTREEAAEYLTYTQLTDRLKETVDLTDEERDAIKATLAELDKKGAQEAFVNGLMNIGAIALNTFTTVREAIKGMFPPMTAKALRDLANGFEKVTSDILKFITKTNTVRNIVTALIFPFRVLADVIGAAARLLAPFGKLILAAFAPLIGVISQFGEWIIRIRTATGQLNPFADVIDKVSEALSVLFDFAGRVIQLVYSAIRSKLVQKFTAPFQSLIETLNNFKENRLKSLDNFINNIKKADASKVANSIINALRTVYNYAKQIKVVFAPLLNIIDAFNKRLNAANNLKNFNDFQRVLLALRGTARYVFNEITAKLKEMGIDITPLTKRFSDFIAYLSNAGTKIKSIFAPFTTIVDEFNKRLNAAGNLKNFTDLQRILLALRGTARFVFNEISAKLKELGIDIDPIVKGISNAIENIKKFFANLETSEGRANIFNQIKEDISSAMERLTGFINGLGITLPKVLAGGGIAVAGAGLFKLINALKETKELKVKDVFSKLFESLNPVPELFEKLETATSSFNIKNFAISMAILAGALIALSFVPTEKLVGSLGVLGTSLASFIGTVAAVNKIMGDRGSFRLVGMGLGMIAIAGSLLMFAKAVESFKNIDIQSNGEILKIFGTLLLAVTSMRSLAKAAAKNDFTLTNGLALIAAAGSLWMFGKALESYANLKLDENSIEKVLSVLILAISSMGIMAHVVGNANFKFTNGMGLIAMASSMLLLANAVGKLGKLKTAALVKGIIAVGFLTAFVTASLWFLADAGRAIGGKAGLGQFAMLIGLATAIIAFGAVAALLGLLPLGKLAAGITAVGLLGAFAALIANMIAEIGKGVSLKSAISSLLLLGGAVIAITVLGVAVAGLGLLAIPVAAGLVALAAIIGELALVFLMIKKLISPNIKGALLGVLAIGLFGLALGPMVSALKDLGKLNFKKTQQNMLLLGELLLGFLAVMGIGILVGALASGAAPLLLVGIGVIAGVFALFVGAITVLVKDLERLSNIDAESAKTGLELVKEELNILTDLAREFQENSGLFTASIGAALVCLEFGKGLHELANSTFILGLSNAEQARASLKVVREEIGLMVELGDYLASNEGAFGKAILASATAFSFGVGLHGLANDTRILGLVNAEQATAAMEPLRGLISTMIALANTIGSDPTLFGKALTVSADLVAFGLGLLPLVGAEFLAGLTNAENAKANMAQIRSIVRMMWGIATQMSEDASLYYSAKATAEVMKKFGKALIPLVSAEFLAQFVDADTSKSGFEPAKEMVDWLFEVAQRFNGQESLAKSAETAVKSMQGFALALGGLSISSFLSQFVSGDRALEGLEPAKQVIGMLTDLVQSFSSNQGMTSSAETAVNSVNTFVSSLDMMSKSLSSGSWKNVDPTSITSVIDSIYNGLLKLSTISTDMTSVSAALTGVSDIFDSIAGLGTKGGLFGKKSIDVSSITEAFGSVKNSIVDLGNTLIQEDIGNKIITSLINPIVENSNIPVTTIGTMLETMHNTITSFENAFNIDGNNIAVGFINGINSRVQDAYDAGYNLAFEAEHGTRDAGEISSPSKVFEGLGGFIGEGFVDGIQSKYGQISDAAREMANRAYTIVQALTERMNALLAEKNSELRLTPVVDMSSVDQLSSLMTNAQGSHNLGSYQINSEVVDKSIQGRNVISEMKTLHDHIEALAQHMDNLQIVCDTGALVGATSAKMDGQFGIMSMRRGRGN